jgi:hypothetical protein
MRTPRNRRDMRPESGRARGRRGTALLIMTRPLSEVQDLLAERFIRVPYEWYRRSRSSSGLASDGGARQRDGCPRSVAGSAGREQWIDVVPRHLKGAVLRFARYLESFQFGGIVSQRDLGRAGLVVRHLRRRQPARTSHLSVPWPSGWGATRTAVVCGAGELGKSLGFTRS